MDRNALRTIAIVIVVVAIIAVGAATLQSTEQVKSGGEGEGSAKIDRGNRSSMGAGNQSGDEFGNAIIGNGSDIEREFNWICISLFTDSMVQLAFALAVLGIGIVVARRRTGLLALSIVIILLLISAYLYFLTTAGCGGPGNLKLVMTQGGGESAGGGGGAPLGGDESNVFEPNPQTWLFVVGGLIVGVVAVALWASSDRTAALRKRDDGDELATGVADQTGIGIDAVGRAAGRAADRIEDSDDFENEVYRAWAEMALSLEVDHPDSSTPAEFADAAVDGGMDRADVDQLTRLFEDVRYGGRPATPERERAAVETLRRVEDQYADGGDEE